MRNRDQPQRQSAHTAILAATAVLGFLFLLAISNSASGDLGGSDLAQGLPARQQLHLSTGSTRQLMSFQESAADDGRAFLQAMPRRTWGMQDVSDQFCAWDDASSACNWTDYAQAISLVALPSFVVGVFFTLVVGIAFCVRCCCLRKRCCLLPWRGYSIEAFLISALLILLSLCILGLVGLGVLGNVWSHMGIIDTSSAASNFTMTVINITSDAGALLIEIEPSYSDQVATALVMAHDVQNNLDDVLDILDKAELARFVFFLAIYGALLLVVLCTFLFVCFFRSFLFTINFWYAWLLFIFIFLTLTFCIVLGTVVSDVCDVYDDAQSGDNSSIFTKFIGSSWGDCSALQEIIDPLYQEYNQTVTEGCGYYEDLCSNDASGVGNCTTCDLASNKTQILYTTVDEVLYCGTSMEQYCPSNAVCASCTGCACYNHTQTIEQCSTDCLEPNYRNMSAQVVQYAVLMSQLDAMIARVMPYAGCQLVTRLVEATNEPLCVEYLSGDFLLVLSAIGVCVIWLFYQFVLVLAYERAKLRFDEEGDRSDDSECEEEAEGNSFPLTH